MIFFARYFLAFVWDGVKTWEGDKRAAILGSYIISFFMFFVMVLVFKISGILIMDIMKCGIIIYVALVILCETVGFYLFGDLSSIEKK